MVEYLEYSHVIVRFERGCLFNIILLQVELWGFKCRINISEAHCYYDYRKSSVIQRSIEEVSLMQSANTPCSNLHCFTSETRRTGTKNYNHYCMLLASDNYHLEQLFFRCYNCLLYCYYCC